MAERSAMMDDGLETAGSTEHAVILGDKEQAGARAGAPLGPWALSGRHPRQQLVDGHSLAVSVLLVRLPGTLH